MLIHVHTIFTAAMHYYMYEQSGPVWAAAIGAAAGITLTLAALLIYRSNRQLCTSHSSSGSSSGSNHSSSGSGARNSSYARVDGDVEGIEM
jgi:uncharacterized membrane protein YgcG